jgi:hydrophobe/amphiphile efflux-3 (HAE3) family protein
VRSFFARLAASAVERPTQVIVAAVLLTLLGAVAALRLAPQASVSSLTGRGSSTYAATQELHHDFGDDPVVILVRSDLQKLLLTPERGRLLALEGCLSGKTPGGRIFEGHPAPPPCARIARLHPSFAVYGPGTFLNQFAIRTQKLYLQQYATAQSEARAAAAAAARRAKRQGYNAAGQRQAALIAGRAILQNFQQQLGALEVNSGETGLPSFDNPRFVSSVVFDNRRAGGYPKPQFSSLFPSRHSALVYVRLRPDLSTAERERAIDLYRAAIAYPKFHLRTGSYVMSGVPVVVSSLSHDLSSQTFILLAVAMAVMAIALTLVFGPPLRLLPLALALAATAIAFGLLSLVGGSLTMAAIAVLPVLIGLGVDYAIQLHVRFTERVAAGSTPVRAAVEAAAAGGPVIATAALATAAGFVVLLLPALSPVPLVRTFALLLVVGVVIAFAVALTAGLAALSLTRAPSRGAGRRRAPSTGRVAPYLRRAADLRARIVSRMRAAGRRAIATAIAAPGRVLAVGAVLAVVGWVAGTQVGLVSDFRALLPRDLPALHGVDQIQRATGASGEVDVLVRADDLTDPKVVEWMSSFEQRVLADHGFGGQYPSCRSPRAEICPAIALPDLFHGAPKLTRSEVRDVIRILPPYFASAFIAHPPQSGKPDTTVIQFRVKALPFDRQKQLYDDIRSLLHPPPGVSARLAGLPVLFADASSAQNSSRLPSALAALAAVALVLFCAYRSARRAFVPLIPIVLATGWSALVLYVSRVPLNPLSATLGTLVIAIATEFSVILAARFEQERQAAGSVGEALRRAYARTGAAVAASGVTAICGFAVLGVSDIRMLRDFGLVTVFDLAVALAGVMIVLPAALVWAEDGFPIALPRWPRRARSRQPSDGRWLPARLAARLARR